MHGRMAEGDEVIDLDDEATATDAVGEAPQPGDPEAAEEEVTDTTAAEADDDLLGADPGRFLFTRYGWRLSKQARLGEGTADR